MAGSINHDHLDVFQNQEKFMKPRDLKNDFQKVIWAAIEQEGGEFYRVNTIPVIDGLKTDLRWFGHIFRVYFQNIFLKLQLEIFYSMEF